MKSHDKFAPIAALLQDGTHRGVFTAAQAAWSENGGPTEVRCAGEIAGRPVTAETRFDIASLTKLFTASVLLRLAARGTVDLSAPITEILSSPLPRCGASSEALLAHESGLPAWLPFFEAIPIAERGTNAARAAVQAAVRATPPLPTDGATAYYSDLGFILLADVAEAVANAGTAELIEKEVCAPLGLGFQFRPVGRSPLPEPGTVAPTELCPWRNRRLIGEVHDDNAWTMGGVAGHAGLFGTAPDAVRLGNAWLDALAAGRWLDAKAAQAAVRRRPSGRGLGWDLKSPSGSSAGAAMSDDAFGHLGFTGCSLWVDPRRKRTVALFTNRVFGGRENNAIRRFRPEFHDMLARCLDGKRSGTDR